MALLLRFAPPTLVALSWLGAFVLFPPGKARRWPALLLPMAVLMISSILAFSGAKIALDQVRFGAVDPTEAAAILGGVLLIESQALAWSAVSFFGVCAMEALRVPSRGPSRRSAAVGILAVIVVGLPSLALGFGDSAFAWLLPAMLAPGLLPIVVGLLGPDPDPTRRAQRMVTLGAGGVMGVLAAYLSVNRLNEGWGYRELASDPTLQAMPELAGWGLNSGFVVCAIVGACALIALVPARVGQAPEAFATSLLIALGVSTAALIFNVPTHFAKDRVRAYSRPGQFVVLESRLDALPAVAQPGDPGQGSDAILMLEGGRWFDSRTGVPVELPLLEPERYTDNLGRLVLALRPHAPAQELLASPFGVDQLAVVVRGEERAPHDALSHTVYGVLPFHQDGAGEPIEVTELLSDLLERCPQGCAIRVP